MKRLKGKTAVVTGGGSGIGFASAKRFMEEGAFVFIFGRTQTRLDEALDAVGAGMPLGRAGNPDEIASVAAFLASGDSSFMTGSEVFADGGKAQV